MPFECHLHQEIVRILMIIPKNLIKRIELLDKVLTPINLLIKIIYKSIVPQIMTFYFSIKLQQQTLVFVRQGVIKSPGAFNFIFSDLDIGIVYDGNNIKQLKDCYYNLKFYLKFLGELEIYTSLELRILKQQTIQTRELYEIIRLIRQMHWLKIRALNPTTKRRNYHRIKDVRKILILRRKIPFNANGGLSYLYNLLSSALENKPIGLEKLSIANEVFFCNYLFLNININSSNKDKCILILSLTPPGVRDKSINNPPIAVFRNANPEIKMIFEKLNLLEFIIASAFIRGSISSEDWHQPWLTQLSDSLDSFSLEALSSQTLKSDS